MQRQADQVEAAGGDVFAQLPGLHIEAREGEILQPFLADQMHLTQVRLQGIDRHPRAMLHKGAAMGVALNPQAFQQGELRGRSLGEGMRGGATDADDTHITYPNTATPIRYGCRNNIAP